MRETINKLEEIQKTSHGEEVELLLRWLIPQLERDYSKLLWDAVPVENLNAERARFDPQRSDCSNNKSSYQSYSNTDYHTDETNKGNLPF